MTRTRPRYPSSNSSASEKPLLNATTIAILSAVFVVGVLVGTVFSSTASLNPENVASREFIDRSAPNYELCAKFGASSTVSDLRVFVTYNPFNVYVTQPSIRPGCVLRRNNWSILEQRRLVTSEQVRDCKNRMNTFGFTGDLNSSPEIECIYQNESADNFFLNQPGTVGPRPETDNF
ncbi:MAG: DUF3172 domain-containing protein [Symploca sp. SIO2E9]|nr:DUF3172 domain-containing protein [Symploca sp. SIO2E9]